MNLPFSEKHLVYRGKSWNTIVSNDQSFLGRCIVYLTTRETDDLMSLTTEERTELWEEIMPRLVRSMQASFAPDRINYAHLANAVHHVHWHVVPRYERDPLRIFEGCTFRDERVGRNYLNVPERTLGEPLMQKITERLRERFDLEGTPVRLGVRGVVSA